MRKNETENIIKELRVRKTEIEEELNWFKSRK